MEMLERTTAIVDATLRGDQAQENRLRYDPVLRQLGVNCGWSPIIFDERREGARIPAPRDAYGEGRQGLWAGDRAPNAPGLQVVGDVKRQVDLFDLIDAGKHTVLIFIGRDAALEHASSFLEIVGRQPVGTCKTILVFGSAPNDPQLQARADNSVVDSQGLATQFYKIKEGVRAVAVRPDAVIGAMMKTPGGLAKAFELVFDVGN
jgi:hypothetical protein